MFSPHKKKEVFLKCRRKSNKFDDNNSIEGTSEKYLWNVGV